MLSLFPCFYGCYKLLDKACFGEAHGVICFFKSRLLFAFRPQISHVQWLSYNDVSRWMAEQNKDVQRLCKHIEQMAATIDPLKAEVAAFEKETKAAESRAKQCEKDLKLEKETQAAVKKQFEVSAAGDFLVYVE